tara:strand:+ start:5648 stop:6820 length:1173 start_codon:yes stop_codon:yes gene_type:complete
MQQGLESLKDFQKFVSNIGGLGRYEDTYIVHAAEGETVVPMEVLDRNPVLKKRLFKSMVDMGIDPGRYIVGNELNSINPVTGQPEFFLNKIVKRLKKAAGDISGYAAPIAGAMFGPGIGAAVGAGLGAFKRENPGDPNQALNMALLGGGTGIASNILGGGGPDTNFLTGKGLSGRYGTKNPFDIGKQILGMGDLEQVKGNQSSNFGNLFDGTDNTSVDIETAMKNYAKETGLVYEDLSDLARLQLRRDITKDAKKKLLGGMSIPQIASLFGLSTAALGLLIDQTTDDEQQSQDLSVARINDTLGSGYAAPATIVPAGYAAAADGGLMDLRADGGMSEGPGTETSDSIPAMLSDGEFVMTAQAVRGAGGGDRREGAKRMYEMMNQFEGTVA